MTPADTVRWCVIAACILNIGAILRLSEVIAYTYLPPLWTRMLGVSNMLAMFVIAYGVHSRLGLPVTWRTSLLGIAAVLEFVALIGLRRWYTTDEGRRQADGMCR